MTLNEPGLIFMAVAFWVMYTREWYAHRRTQRDLAHAMALEQQERARRQEAERQLEQPVYRVVGHPSLNCSRRMPDGPPLKAPS